MINVTIYKNGATVEVVNDPLVPPVIEPPVGSNVARDGQVTASSVYSTPGDFSPRNAINGDRKGKGTAWNQGGMWIDDTIAVWPDIWQVVFDGTKQLNHVEVYGCQDDYENPVEPGDSMTGSLYGLIDFTLDYWNGTAWVNYAPPVVGNNLVKRSFVADVITNGLRITVHKGGSDYSRIVEVEAWGVPAVAALPLPPPIASEPPINADPSWETRSTAAGVMLATDFSTDEQVLPYRYANAGSAAQFEALCNRVQRDVLDGVPCIRMDIVANDPQWQGYTQGQAWRRRFKDIDQWPNDGDGIGNAPFWIQFGLRIPASRLVPDVAAGAGGTWKFAIVANQSVSNPMGMGGQSSNNISHVLTSKRRPTPAGDGNYQWPITYRHTNTVPNGVPFEEPLASGDLNLSPGWDKGPHPDYHDQFCSYQDSRGCPLWPTDTWVWFQYRVKVASYGGSTGNELDLWWAVEGDAAWTLLCSARNYETGQEAPWPNGFNAVWLTPFETDRRAAGTVDSFMHYRHLIVSTQEIAFPMGAVEPPPGDTELAKLAASMPVGTWAELVTHNIDSVIGNSGGNSGITIPFAGAQPWNGVAKKIHIIGADHGASGYYMTYDEATNTWTRHYPTDYTSHAYQHNAVDSDGNVYGLRCADSAIYKFGATNPPTKFADVPYAMQNLIANAMFYWKGPLAGSGAKGALVVYIGEFSTIHVLNLDNGTWTNPQWGFVPNVTGFYHVIMQYSEKKNCAVGGGGNNYQSAYSKEVWRFNADASKTKLPDAPFQFGINHGMGIVTDPVSGNFLFEGFGELWELDPVGTGTWKKQSGTRVPPTDLLDPAVNSNAGNVWVSCPTHGVMLVVDAIHSRTPIARVRVYKHA